MKRASKILTLILIVVFVLTVFVGCDLVGRDVARYRSTNVMKVGDQEITVGKLLDTFNTYYNNYYYYISAGYLTADSLLEMVMNSLMQQYIQIDAYVKDTSNVQTPDLKGVVKNAEYLTQEQFEYCIKYVKYSSYTTFDNTVVTTLSVKHDIGDAKAEDTSRDFIEYDELYSETSYVDHLLKKNFVNDDADEYFDKYYASGSVDFTSLDKLISDYVYTDKTDDYKAIIDELNERLEDDEDEITLDEYVEAQQKAIDQYSDSIKNNYGITIDEFLKGQVADMVSSGILALWSYKQYKDLDGDVVKIVKEANQKLVEEQEARFSFNGNFDSFITGLTDSSLIYNVPEEMQNKYVFVKNILIPFTEQQSALLSAGSDTFGGTDTDAYRKLRNLVATEIAAEYFYSDKYEDSIEALFSEFLEEDEDEDAESKYEKIEHIFTIKDGKIAINTSTVEDKESGIYKGALAQFFGDDGSVKEIEGKSKSQTIVELMKRFNTDTAQHSKRYDYVVYVGDDWEDYSHAWVEEFYTAVNELRNDEGKFDGKEKYAMCVSTYGVHIIYVEGFVEDAVYNPEVDWTLADTWNDTSSLNYVRYKAEFDSLVTKTTQEAFEKLQKEYLAEDSNLVTVNKNFKRFLKDNGFTFDLDEYKKETLEELD